MLGHEPVLRLRPEEKGGGRRDHEEEERRRELGDPVHPVGGQLQPVGGRRGLVHQRGHGVGHAQPLQRGERTTCGTRVTLLPPPFILQQATGT